MIVIKVTKKRENAMLDLLDAVMKCNEYEGYTLMPVELGDRIGRSKSWVCTALNTLVARGFLNFEGRKNYRGSKRKTHTLTDKGQKALDMDTLVWKE